MSVRLATVALALGVLSCDPATLNGTALFVPVAWQSGWPIETLRFSGVANGSPAFTPQTRPEVAAGTLASPQSVRILLEDSLGGSMVDVSVEGLQADGGVFARGSAPAAVQKSREVQVSIELTQGSAGGGSGTGGGSAQGGGNAQGGGPGQGGGSAMGGGSGGGAVDGGCECASGCCFPNETKCARVNGNFFTCPKAALAFSTCAPEVCDNVTATRCGASGCQCGVGAPCGPGLRCSGSTATATCICDTQSNCDGCCKSATECTALVDVDASHCGNAGEACANCSSGTCTNSGVCSGMLCVGKCASGSTCEAVTFPTCQVPLTAACTACDSLRSNQCSMVSACGCGDKVACDATHTCIGLADGGSRCDPILGG